jgi:hypothetical protein
MSLRRLPSSPEGCARGERGSHRRDGDRRPREQADIGGLTIVDVPTREEALQWAATIAVACRCAQEIHEVGHDPAVGN